MSAFVFSSCGSLVEKVMNTTSLQVHQSPTLKQSFGSQHWARLTPLNSLMPVVEIQQTEFKIGRGDVCYGELKIDDGRVSNLHAKITKE